jgi:pimeloyl-ACP methyl ester carboxylesterase
MKWLLLLLLLPLVGACVHSAIYTSRVEAKYPPLGEFVSVNGKDMHVIVQGDGAQTVLMIHGASANAREFTASLGPLLDGDYTVLMADRPGHGYSDRPEDSRRLDVQAALMAEVLETYAPGRRAVVVGHSFGGAVALRLALDRPDLVDGLVLLAPVSHDWGGGGMAWYNQWGAPPLIGHAFSQLVPIVGPSAAESGVASTFAPEPVPENYYEQAGTPLLFRPEVFRANARDLTSLQAQVRKQSERYGELAMPVVVFSGEDDTVIKPELHVGELRQQVPGIRVIELDGVGHMPHHSVGEQVIAEIARLAADEPVR